MNSSQRSTFDANHHHPSRQRRWAWRRSRNASALVPSLMMIGVFTVLIASGLFSYPPQEEEVTTVALLERTIQERDELKLLLQQLQEQLAVAQNKTTTTTTVEPEFPYRLDCPSADLPPNDDDYVITLAYHVGMVNNWKTIVRDQMNTLTECGLGNKASEFILSYSGGELQELQDVLQPSGLFLQNDSNRTTTIVEAVSAPWEGLAMNTIHAHCMAKNSINKKKHTVVFYFHNKGSSKYNPEWRSQIDRVWTYSRSLYWRKYMEYFTLERPQLCLDHILNKGAGLCGIMFHDNHFSGALHIDSRWMVGIEWIDGVFLFFAHYSELTHILALFLSNQGNFWVASCNYVQALTPLNMTAEEGLNYVAAEVWIGGKRDDNINGRKPVSLHENPNEFGLYRHLILPSEYSDHGARWKLSYHTPSNATLV